MSAHTPGPWVIDSELPPNSRSVIARIDGIPISGNTDGPHLSVHEQVSMSAQDAAYGGTVYAPTSMANARLIAAAPEMLDALRAAEVQFEQLHKMFHNAADFDAAFDAVRAAIRKATGDPL